ncbi:MAG TPA: putative toxin-antitoxin system toxin component, PIN family [Bryobacteraceae bacterium]
MLVVLDSNIWVSAFQFLGKPHSIVQLAFDGEIEVATSEHIIDETTRILSKKFDWSEEQVSGARGTMRMKAQIVTPTEIINAVTEDPDDNRILECAKAAGADTIITGDKHLLQLGSFQGIAMVTAAAFLREREEP